MRSTTGRILRIGALVVAVGLAPSACGDDADESSEAVPEAVEEDSLGTAEDSDGSDSETTETRGLVESEALESEPARGGEIVYALEAETATGFCTGESNLAISGIQVVRSIFDPLVKIDANGDAIPWLAESIEPNDDLTEWTIKVRDGVTFHDGSPLTGEVVKNNVDAWRGAYENRNPQLFRFVLANIATTELVDPMTVKVTTTVPWPALPGYLTAWERLGVMAQAQLDSNECGEEPIGTGPFRLADRVINDHTTVVRNDDWWYADLVGEDLPLLDSIEYRPMQDSAARLRALQGGEADISHFAGGRQIDDLRDMAEGSEVDLVESDVAAEVQHVLLNHAQPPFDNVSARRALQYAVDRAALIEIANSGVGSAANGPNPPGAIGYLEDNGWPEADLDAAREHLAAYEAETGEPLSFTLTTSADPNTLAIAQTLQQFWKDMGADVSLEPIGDQSQLISTLLGAQYGAMLFRNHPGGDPDANYVYWHSSSPANLSNVSDPTIDEFLDTGRSEPDPATRQAIYEDLNRHLADQATSLWNYWVTWAVPTQTDVHGVLPDELFPGVAPTASLISGHDVFAMWVDGS